MPAAPAPEQSARDALMLISTFLVNALHRRIHRVPRNAMKTQLFKCKPRPDIHRIRRIAAPPGRTIADDKAARRPAIAPVEPMQANEPDVLSILVDDSPGEIRLAFGFNAIEKLLLL